jgi:hypothetical protein
MSYGELKIDTITFTSAGVDTSVSVSGLVQNPTFTGNITTTGTISGDIIRGNEPLPVTLETLLLVFSPQVQPQLRQLFLMEIQTPVSSVHQLRELQANTSVTRLAVLRFYV